MWVPIGEKVRCQRTYLGLSLCDGFESRWWGSDEIQMFYWSSTPPTAQGIPLLDSLIAFLSFWLWWKQIPALNFLKTNFLSFPSSVLYHLNVKIQSSLYPKDVARECLPLSNYLAEMLQIYEVKNIWGLYKGAHVGWLFLRTKTSYSKDYICQKQKSKIMLGNRNHSPAGFFFLIPGF